MVYARLCWYSLVVAGCLGCGTPPDDVTELGISIWRSADSGAKLDAAHVDRRYRDLSEGDPSGLRIHFHDLDFGDGTQASYESGRIDVAYWQEGRCDCAPLLHAMFAHAIIDQRSGDPDRDRDDPLWYEVDDLWDEPVSCGSYQDTGCREYWPGRLH